MEAQEQEKEDKEIRISSPSQELLERIIRTIPAMPVGERISFSLKEVMESAYWREEAKVKEYLSFCEENNILPYLGLEFEYSLNHDFIVPKVEDFRGVYNKDGDKALKRKINTNFLNKNKFGNISVKLFNYELNFLKDGLLDDLLENEYQITSGFFRLFKRGDYEDMTMSFNDRVVSLRSTYDYEEIRQVEAWFKELKAGYESKQEPALFEERDSNPKISTRE